MYVYMCVYVCRCKCLVALTVGYVISGVCDLVDVSDVRFKNVVVAFGCWLCGLGASCWWSRYCTCRNIGVWCSLPWFGHGFVVESVVNSAAFRLCICWIEWTCFLIWIVLIDAAEYYMFDAIYNLNMIESTAWCS